MPCHKFESAQHVTRFYKLVRYTDAPIQPQSMPHVKDVVKNTQNHDRIFARPESSLSNFMVNRYHMTGLRLK